MQKDPFLQNQKDLEDNPLKFEGFNSRLIAVILDGLIVGIPIAGATLYNLLVLKSFWCFVLITTVSIAYKPLMEGFYGATLGKMSMGMRVVDYDGHKINAPQAILRSVFTIAQALVTLPVYFFIFQDKSLMEMTDYFKMSEELGTSYPMLGLISGISFFIMFVEMITLLTDPPYWRSLHDRIAKTYVVES
ncbi:RDD family protein [Nonlabens antarcticus]|uniref:RDD family protein n=1 Tax=Nonlabens antarcticus TaxID=392714 RepID=UPI001891601F|nr:RDD family protein [Nonlabens antarcticus]